MRGLFDGVAKCSGGTCAQHREQDQPPQDQSPLPKLIKIKPTSITAPIHPGDLRASQRPPASQRAQRALSPAATRRKTERERTAAAAVADATAQRRAASAAAAAARHAARPRRRQRTPSPTELPSDRVVTSPEDKKVAALRVRKAERAGAGKRAAVRASTPRRRPVSPPPGSQTMPAASSYSDPSKIAARTAALQQRAATLQQRSADQRERSQAVVKPVEQAQQAHDQQLTSGARPSPSPEEFYLDGVCKNYSSSGRNNDSEDKRDSTKETIYATNVQVEERDPSLYPDTWRREREIGFTTRPGSAEPIRNTGYRKDKRSNQELLLANLDIPPGTLIHVEPHRLGVGIYRGRKKIPGGKSHHLIEFYSEGVKGGWPAGRGSQVKTVRLKEDGQMAGVKEVHGDQLRALNYNPDASSWLYHKILQMRLSGGGRIYAKNKKYTKRRKSKKKRKSKKRRKSKKKYTKRRKSFR